MAACLEGGEVVDDFAAEEGGAVGEGGFVDDYGCAFCLDTLHHSLDAALTEVVGVGFHREPINADCRRNSL